MDLRGFYMVNECRMFPFPSFLPFLLSYFPLSLPLPFLFSLPLFLPSFLSSFLVVSLPPSFLLLLFHRTRRCKSYKVGSYFYLNHCLYNFLSSRRYIEVGGINTDLESNMITFSLNKLHLEKEIQCSPLFFCASP